MQTFNFLGTKQPCYHQTLLAELFCSSRLFITSGKKCPNSWRRQALLPVPSSPQCLWVPALLPCCSVGTCSPSGLVYEVMDPDMMGLLYIQSNAV